MRPRIGLALVLDRFAAVDAEVGSDDVVLLLPLRLQFGLVGDSGIEIERFAFLVEPAEEVITLHGGIFRLCCLFAVLDNLRANVAAAVGVEDHFIRGRCIAPDVSGVLDAGVPAAALLAVGQNHFIEQSVLGAGEAKLDLSIIRLVRSINRECAGFQCVEHRLIVDGFFVLAAVTMRPRIGLALVLDRFVPIDAEVGSDDVGVRLPLCGEDHVARGDGVGSASLEERFIGRIVCAVSVKLGGIIFIRNDFNAPALEGIAFASRVGGHGDFAAADVVVVDIVVVVLRHVADRLGAAIGETVFKCRVVERQEAVEVIALALARVTIVGAIGGHVLQLVPVDTALTIRVEALCIRMLFVGKAIALQLVHDLEQIRAIEHPCSRVRRQILRRGHFADRDPLFVGVVIAAVLAGPETGTCERGRVQLTSDVLLDRRVRANQLHALGIDGLDEEVDVGGIILLPDSVEGGAVRSRKVVAPFTRWEPDRSRFCRLFGRQRPAEEGIACTNRNLGGVDHEACAVVLPHGRLFIRRHIGNFIRRVLVIVQRGHLATLDFEGHIVACHAFPFISRPVIDQREHLLGGFTLFKMMGAVRRIVRRTNRLHGILGNIRGRINCDIAGIARFFTAVYLTDRVGGSVVVLRQRKAKRPMLLICRAVDTHTTGIKSIHVVLRRELGRVKLQGVLRPDRVEVGVRVGCCNRTARADGRLRCVLVLTPAEEVVAVSARPRVGNGEHYHAGVGRFSLRVGIRHIGDCVSRVFVVVQGVGFVIRIVKVQLERERAIRKILCSLCHLGCTHISAIDIKRRLINNFTIRCHAQLPAALVGVSASICIPLELIANLM